MTREELYKIIIDASDYTNKLSDDLEKVIWGRTPENAELFDSMCKSEQVQIIDFYNYTTTFKNKLRWYKSMIIGER